VSRDFLLQVFFIESSSPKPLEIILGSFGIFSKIRVDIRNSRCSIGVRGFRLKFFLVLSETVFTHIFPVSNQNENERRTLFLSKSQAACVNQAARSTAWDLEIFLSDPDDPDPTWTF
jgi:hypothetical protein